MLLVLLRYAIDLAIDAYMLVLFIRMILDWVSVLSPRWYPRGVAATLVSAVYTVTEPPLRWLRRYIKPIPMGMMYLDVSFMVLWFALVVLRILI
ncbi:YggT family protein [Bifidobacterium avesanii]|uniref:YggT family protein n=1 Tax=Bifidobacterium avesanii TaxID=1798157 RepID=A0A7K3TI39_9BIFI|nr:YggT family protein [Bifidobacterium avesanii]KAB8290998.1 hemolysin [Bifidobacterium avesanii]NEG78765.1 YggT family protein [Bifidobacterium avesanii]